MILLALAVVFIVVFVVRWRREPRRLSNGVWAVLALGFGLLAGASLGGPFALPFGIAILVLGLVAVLSLPAAAAFLIGNGLVMLRRERPTPGNLLGLLVGLALVGVMVGTVLLLRVATVPAVAAAVWVIVVTSYFAFVFLCFAAFCLLYSRRRSRRPVAAVVILGSGVRGGVVPPLLAARLARAVQVRDDHLAAGWPAPLLVPSGGQGPDEIEPEARSMARWLWEHDVPDRAVVLEPRARTTEENLRLSAELVADQLGADQLGAGPPPSLPAADPADPADPADAADRSDPDLPARPGPVAPGSVPLAVVTNDYHSFRAALQARRLGLDAEAIGARTAPYFLPSAYLREFVAVLREHRWLHLVVVVSITVAIALAVVNLAPVLGVPR